ncbi:MAG: protein kinase [Chloroflexota bacterium]|nr:protein kinase [Chloroflexota bacterium]
MRLDVDSLLRDRYRIIKKLIQSGMGILYLAHDEALNVDVAVKENQYTTAGHSHQFHQEATILARLRHSNLPRVIDHFVIEGQGEYLVMDYIEGMNLQENLESRGKPLPESEVVKITAVICDALEYLHSRKPAIIHQDIKPANIITTPGDDVMLVDFGLAKPYERGKVFENSVQGVTAGYSPIEQYGSDTDVRSDIYTLGATMYTLLTGQIPLEAIERAVGDDELQPIKQINPAISKSIQDVIEKAMAVMAEDRFQSVNDFRIKLFEAHPFLDTSKDKSLPDEVGDQIGQTTTRLNAEPGQGTSKTNKKKRIWLWLLPLIAVVCAASATALIYLTNQSWGSRLFHPSPIETQPIVTLAEQIQLSSPTTQSSTMLPSATTANMDAIPAVITTQAQTATTLPEGTPQGGGQGQIAFVSERTGLPQIYLINVDGSGLVQVTSKNEGACQPEWSPDGSSMAFISPCEGNKEQYDGASIFVVSFESESTSQISTLGSGDYDPAWSPDGRQLAFTSLQTGRPQVFIYDFETGEAQLLMNRTMVNRMPVWSPDGSQIVFVTPNPDNNLPTLFIVDSAGQENPRTILGSAYRETYRPDWSPEGEMIVFDLGEEGQIGSRLLPNNQNIPISTPLEIIENPGFSPDSQWLVCNGVMDIPGQDIFLMPRTGTGLSRLTNNPANDYQPAWRP